MTDDIQHEMGEMGEGLMKVRADLIHRKDLDDQANLRIAQAMGDEGRVPCRCVFRHPGLFSKPNHGCPHCNGTGKVPLPFDTDWNALARAEEWCAVNLPNDTPAIFNGGKTTLMRAMGDAHFDVACGHCTAPEAAREIAHTIAEALPEESET